MLVSSWVQHPYLPIRLPNPHTQDSPPRPSTSTHAPQSLNSAFSSTIVQGGRRWERSCMRRGWHCLRPRQARAEVHIDYPAAERLSLFSVCFTPSFTAHSSQRVHHNRIRPHLLAAEHLHHAHLHVLFIAVCLARDDACDVPTVPIVVDGRVALLREEQCSPRGSFTEVREWDLHGGVEDVQESGENSCSPCVEGPPRYAAYVQPRVLCVATPNRTLVLVWAPEKNCVS